MQKRYKFLLLLTGLVLSFNALFAQGTGPAPCGDPDDPNYDPNMCPLDTWVLVFVVIAVITGYRYLKMKRMLNLQ